MTVVEKTLANAKMIVSLPAQSSFLGFIKPFRIAVVLKEVEDGVILDLPL